MERRPVRASSVVSKPKTRQRRREAPPRAPRAAAPIPMPRALVALAVVVATAAATLERWWFSAAWGESHSLTSAFYYGDATRFLSYAQAIVQGRLFDNGIPFHPPGWPLAVAEVMRLTGSVASVPVPALKLVLAVLSGLTVGLAVLLAYETAGGGAMLAVALLGTFNFGHIVEGAVANSEALYGLLTAIAMFGVWRWLRDGARRPAAWAALAGAAGGYAMVVRAEFLACAVLFAALAWWMHRARRAASPVDPALVVFLAVFGAVLVPTTVWHWRTLTTFNERHVSEVAGPLPRFAPVTSYGPFNFAMANHENADGGPNRDHPMLDQCNQAAEASLTAGELDLACPAVYDLYVHGYGIGLAWLLNNPGAALSLMANKAGMAIGFLAQGYFVDDLGAGVDGVRRRVDFVDPASRWLVPVHLLLLAAGLTLLRRQTLALGVLLAPLGALVASTLLFYGYVRLGVAYLPAVWVLQGAALAAAGGRLTGLRASDRRVVAGALAALVVLTAAEGVRARTPRGLTLDGQRTPSGMLMQDETLTVVRAPQP